MTEFKKINEEPIEIEYVEDEHNEERDFEPSFWLAAAGYNRRYYLDSFIRVHNNPWIGASEYPEHIHAVEADEYYRPLYIELVGDEAVNVYEAIDK